MKASLAQIIKRSFFCILLATILLGGAKPAHAQGHFGFNIWYLATLSPEQINNVLTYLNDECNAAIVRFWGYESTFGVDGYNNIGKVLDNAPSGMQFIIALEDFPHGPPVSDPTSWFGSGYQTSYRNHVTRVLDRYGERSNVLVWEIMNEPHCKGDAACFPHLRAFMEDISRQIAQRTSAYVSPGLMGRHLSWAEYEDISNLPYISANSCHYHDDAANDVGACTEALAHSGGVGFFYVGEAGYKACDDGQCNLSCSGEDIQNRADRVAADMSTLANANAFLLWQFSTVEIGICDPWSVFPEGMICGGDFTPGTPGGGRCVLAKGLMPTSERAPTPGAFAEKDNECTGTLWGIITCWLRKFIQWAQEVPWHLVATPDDGLRAFYYAPRTPNVPIFRIAQRALLRTVTGVRRVDGVVARMLPPGYTQDGTNTVQQLGRAEGQSSDALVISNGGDPRGLSTGSGDLHMEFFGPGYEVTAQVPYIPVLKHKAALLTQGLVPGAPKTVVPRVSCAPPIEDAIIINETFRNIAWDLNEGDYAEEEVLCEQTDPDDPDCNGILEEEGEDGNCPCEGAGNVRISADLDTQTKVALTSLTWQNIAGGSGFLDIIKPPRNLAFCQADALTMAKVTYRSETMGDLNNPAGFPISDLGGVGLAFDCVMNAMLMPPIDADKNACKDVLIEPSLLVQCTPPPPCWAGSPNDVEAERPGECPAPYNRCTIDEDWHIIPACTFKLDPDAMEYTLFCYGNACRGCNSPGIPSPSGCCGSGRTVPGSGASCANPAGTWWIPAGNFPGEVLYNGTTYTPPDDYPWSGVFICDSNEYGCGACTGGGTFYAPCKEEMIAATWTPASSSLAAELGVPPKLASYPAETETSGQIAGETAPHNFSPRQNRKDNGGSFFITFADIIGGAIRAVLNL